VSRRGFTSREFDANLVLVPIRAKVLSSISIRSSLLFLALVMYQCDSTRFANAQPPAAPVVVVHARKFAFVPSEITLKKGQTTKLVLISDDVRHGLAVKGLGIRVDIPAGHRTEISVTPAQTGDFPGACSVYCGSGHRDMEFLIHVVN